MTGPAEENGAPKIEEFVVKVQVPLDDPSYPCLAYNKERTHIFQIPYVEPIKVTFGTAKKKFFRALLVPSSEFPGKFDLALGEEVPDPGW